MSELEKPKNNSSNGDGRSSLKVSRRSFLKILAAAGVLTSLGPLAKTVASQRYLTTIATPRLEYPAELRGWEKLYRDMWSYDKAARSTHGVNCTGSCSWMVYVKDGIIAYELQATDYPDIGPSYPNVEPRGCPRGASFSWYIYSPLRVKYPYVRKPLLELWREARSQYNDPVEAWASIVEDPEKRSRYVRARGMGGWVRADWDTVLEIIASSLVYTIKKYGPDRIFGFTPIPAMSPVSYASGARFIELIGGSMGSFYDWYADLPPASPQIWGEQTDVPESADWFNAAYIINFGTNIPMTRTPDAHFFSEVRYKGTKIVVVSPDFSEHTKFADVWVPIKEGTDGAFALSMAHVILKEFYVDRQVDYFIDYVKRFTDLPFLVTLEPYEGGYRPGKFLRLSDLHEDEYHAEGYRDEPNPEWKLLIYDSKTNALRLVNGSIGYRWDGSKKWNLKLEDPVTEDEVDPRLSFIEDRDEVVLVKFPVFGATFGEKGIIERGVPVKRVKLKDGRTAYVATVFDLLLAYMGINRGLPGDYPSSYDDKKPFTPAWQEDITGISRELSIKIAREWADTAAKTKGRVMVMLGPGVNHWFHNDLHYRSILTLVKLTGAEGRNGGGWAHYVGQEKIRTIAGWAKIAFALDWVLPPRHQNSPSFYYVHTDQWRYDRLTTEPFEAPWSDVRERMKCSHPMDCNIKAARMGWLPFYPQFNRSTIELAAEARRLGKDPVQHVVDLLKSGELRLAIEDPDAPENWIRVMFVWRANLLGSSSKGHEYFLKHLLGSPMAQAMSDEVEKDLIKEVVWRAAPEGKLDLLVAIDFRMATTPVYADIVLPAATWYEKYDLSMTDLHTFLHPFTPAVDPLWESKTDWDIFKNLAKKFSEIAAAHFPEEVEDIVARPLWHDTPMEIAQPYGVEKDWKYGEVEPIPGKTMWDLKVVKRDYKSVYKMFITLGPGGRKAGVKGISYDTSDIYEQLKMELGVVYWEKCPDGCPSIEFDKNAAEAILALSPEANGLLGERAFASLESKVGLPMKDLAKRKEWFKFDDLVAQPKRSHTSPMWSGIEDYDRAYAPFTINTEKLVPWRTLSGRQHFYVDHDWFIALGETFPTYKPPIDPIRLGYLKNTATRLGIPAVNGYRVEANGKRYLVLRYLTPHGKWNIHSEYWDNLLMLTLFRGGQVVWLNDEDARWAGIGDNDWIEVVNDNGVIVARVATSPRIPKGVAIMYHAQERHLYVRKSKLTGKKGGIHNSVTRADLKPNLMVGGYAQLSYFFNYYGPTGVNRDTMVIVYLHQKLGSKAPEAT